MNPLAPHITGKEAAAGTLPQLPVTSGTEQRETGPYYPHVAEQPEETGNEWGITSMLRETL